MGRSKNLNVMSLVMITIISVDSIRNLPAGALFGSSLIFYYLLAALVFFIPAGLVSADLAAMFDKKSGIYVWVKEALGTRWGLLAIWLQWIENVVWYPAILSFASSSLVYILAPSYANHAGLLACFILVIFWSLTWLNCRGLSTSALFSHFCTISGLLLPMAIIIGLATVWYLNGHKSFLNFHQIVPHITSNTWVSLTAVMLSLCGIEVATVHAEDVAQPRKAFPKALIISTVIIVLTLILGSLAIAMVIPQHQISLVSGIMQTVDRFLSAYHLRGFLEIFAVMIVLGVLGSVSNWIIAPTRGLHQAACDGYFPKFMSRTNAKQAPTGLLMLQGGIVSILSVLYVVFPNVSDFYWLLTVVAAELYMMMYILMFVAYIIHHNNLLANNQPTFLMKYKWQSLVVAGLGIAGCLLTLAVGLIEPSSVHIASKFGFGWLVALALVVFTVPPFLFYNKTNRQ